MTIQTINNGELGGVVRAKINANFAGLTQSDIAANAPVSINNGTTLLAATHANRQLVYSGANATLTISNDATGGWALDCEILIQTDAASTGVPTLSTPDGKSVRGSKTQPIGAKRKAASAWDVYLLPQSTSSGSTLSVLQPQQQNWCTQVSFGTPTLQNSGVAAPTTAGTVSNPAVAASVYGHVGKARYTGAAAAATSVNVRSQQCVPLGEAKQSLVLTSGIGDAVGSQAAYFMGISTSAAAFNTTTLSPSSDFLGWHIGVGWDVGATGNLQLITAPLSGAGTGIDLGSGFPIPGAAEAVLYQLTLNYFPTSDPGGRRIEWTIADTLSGATASGTHPGVSLYPQTDARLVLLGASRWTIANVVAPILDFVGFNCGAMGKWS